MNILHLISSSNFGGAENYLYLLAKYQNKLGHNIFVYRNKLKKLDSLLKNYTQEDITTNIINSISPYHILKLFFLIKKNDIDIIHTHLSKASILGGFVSKILKIKSFATIHGMNSFKDYYLNDRLIAVSEAVKEKLINTGAEKENIKVIYNGIEKNNNKKKKNFFENDILKLTYIGRLAEEKNIDFLIKTLDNWKYRKWNLKILGEGDLKKKLEEIIYDNNLENKVNFLGFKKNIQKYIFDSDFVILPSKKEGFGISIIEAFSCGVPAIGSNAGGIKEIIDDGENGFIFESNNMDNLIQVLNRVINERKFQEWSKNSYIKFKNRFRIIDNAKKVLKYYEQSK
jgi:glycosyltransferase involved in cell wall biosynthesis